jgi:aflatoxin B1 aldehyde reductase
MFRLTLQKSLRELRMHKLHVYYLGPDRSVPQSNIFRGINAVHQEGLFAQLGLSSLPAWKVSQICELRDREGWVKPSVYQGKCNALHCAVEPELFPLLRYYGIKFYAFNPIAGGFRAGGESHERNKNESYGNEEYFAAISCWIRSLSLWVDAQGTCAEVVGAS